MKQVDDAILRTRPLLADILVAFSRDLRVYSFIVSYHFQGGNLNHADAQYDRAHDPDCPQCTGDPGAKDAERAILAHDGCARLCLPDCFKSDYFGCLTVRVDRDGAGITARASGKIVLKGVR